MPFHEASVVNERLAAEEQVAEAARAIELAIKFEYAPGCVWEGRRQVVSEALAALPNNTQRLRACIKVLNGLGLHNCYQVIDESIELKEEE